MEQWIIRPQNAPIVLRSCSKCGGEQKFVCSGNFRINANGKNLDVWLIYKCAKCDTTWNMEILSRVKPRQIERALYEAIAKNDAETALRYAFDINTQNKNKAVVCCEEVSYTVEKCQTPDTDRAILIISEYDFGLRLDKLLCSELGLSRAKVQTLLEGGVITSEDDRLTAKTKIKGSLKIKEFNLNEKQTSEE